MMQTEARWNGRIEQIHVAQPSKSCFRNRNHIGAFQKLIHCFQKLICAVYRYQQAEKVRFVAANAALGAAARAAVTRSKRTDRPPGGSAQPGRTGTSTGGDKRSSTVKMRTEDARPTGKRESSKRNNKQKAVPSPQSLDVPRQATSRGVSRGRASRGRARWAWTRSRRSRTCSAWSIHAFGSWRNAHAESPRSKCAD